MICFKCKTELDWVNTYFELKIAEHEFKKLNINNYTRYACEGCVKEII